MDLFLFYKNIKQITFIARIELIIFFEFKFVFKLKCVRNTQCISVHISSSEKHEVTLILPKLNLIHICD